jgi:hypothetical protein
VHVPGNNPAVFGSSWDPQDDDNEMTPVADYIWRWESNVPSATNVEYKFAMNESWGTNRGLGNTSGPDLPQENWNLAQSGANITANLPAATCVWEYHEDTETSKLYVNVDFDIDGDVDSTDYTIFASHWLSQNCTTPNWCDGTDLNKSGSVDLYDLAQFTDYWLLDTSQ